MAYVYILQSDKNGKYYVGSTINIEQRIDRHNNGQVMWTKRYLPWQLVFSQRFESYGEARKQEIRLKNFKRKDYIEKIIRGGIILSAKLVPTLSKKI